MTAYYRITDARVLDLTSEQVAALAPAKRDTLRPYIIDPLPTPSATERVEAGPVVVSANEARKTWSLVTLTTEQLARMAFVSKRESDLAAIRQAYSALKNGTGTAAERLTRCERVLARLLLDIFGSDPA